MPVYPVAYPSHQGVECLAFGNIYRSSMPDGWDWEGLVEQWKRLGVSAVANLATVEEATRHAGRALENEYRSWGWDVISLPTIDASVPEMEDLNRALAAAEAIVRSGRHLVVHCLAGQGRSGMFIACLLARLFGLTAEQALECVGASLVPRQRVIVAKMCHSDRK